MSVSDRKRIAKEFVNRWSNRGNEKQDSQSFWLDLLHNVYGIENPTEYIKFEDSISNMMDSTSYMDGYIEKTNILIEQKGQDRDLNKGIRQSDGTYLTPFQQAKRYSANLPYSRRPRWIITSNFKEFFIYDMEQPNAEPSIIVLADLEKEYYRLEILVDKTNTQIEKETEVSIKAGELIGQIYDELIAQYNNPEDSHTLNSLNQLSVRLVFCFYAEDAGLLGNRRILYDYLKDFNTRLFRSAIIDLFQVLNTKVEDRDPYLDEKLAQFPYINGGLFEDIDIEIPQFTDHLRELILENSISDFDWSEISPTIFGAVFESTLNPEERRTGGMHYTSIENIHKVIDPLFLNDLKEELNEIKQLKQGAAIKRNASQFQEKLANLTFFDPAAGSGNFLTETYLSLRELENQAISLAMDDNIRLKTDEDLIKVSLDQFYGIEINDFAVSVAKTALWIAESQMFEETKDLVFSQVDFLPLKSYTNIIEGNALQMDWEEVVSKYDLDYIIGNPPFFGARLMSSGQKEELKEIFKGQKRIGNLDYVAGWYGKAAKYIDQTEIQCAFVSTNSITQGQQVSILWKNLMEEQNIFINFAYQTFTWNSEATNKAAVHCVIVGFSQINNNNKQIFVSNEQVEMADNINAYLVDASNAFIKTRRKPISNVPKMKFGSMPNDGSNLTLDPDEKEMLIKEHPNSKQLIKKIVGAREFINDIDRYCLWIEPSNLKLASQIPPVMKRIEGVKAHRESSKRKSTQKLAEIPYAFGEIRQPDSNYLIVPAVSSENRRYIPIGYADKNIIASNAVLIVPNTSIYHFAILSSNIHMAWMRMVAGRLESRYRYSATIVYNNFPWIELTDQEKTKLNQTGQAILDARELYPKMNLADLYNELIMPPELRKAHQENDRAVMEAYGMPVGNTSESDSVETLFNMYNSITEE